MNIEVYIDPRRANSTECFAQTTINAGKNYSCTLRVELKPLLYRLGQPTEIEIDLLLFGSVVYAIDRLVPRSESDDNWRRNFNVTLPVESPASWKKASHSLNKALSFLTGDTFEFKFVKRHERLWYRMYRRPRALTPITKNNISAVSLFSGGLDSLVGVIDKLQEENENILFVSHRDQTGAGSDQDRLLPELINEYGKRIKPVQVSIRPKGECSEITFRSRSIVFLTLGAYCVSRCKLNELIVPENGMIALNPPLTPARRGSCSTRTAHPYFLAEFQNALNILGFDIALINPYREQTKGELASKCKNLNLLKKVALDSVSCGKRKHRITWKRRTGDIRGCGRCVPCIYRRASLHSIALDTESYGRDVLSNEVDINSGEKYTFDFRDLIYFLREPNDLASMRRILVAGGLNNFEQLSDYAEMILRGKNEILTWIHDKASPDLLKVWKLN